MISLGASIYNSICFLSRYERPKARKSTSFSFLSWNAVHDEDDKEKKEEYKSEASFQIGNVFMIEVYIYIS